MLQCDIKSSCLTAQLVQLPRDQMEERLRITAKQSRLYINHIYSKMFAWECGKFSSIKSRPQQLLARSSIVAWDTYFNKEFASRKKEEEKYIIINCLFLLLFTLFLLWAAVLIGSKNSCVLVHWYVHKKYTRARRIQFNWTKFADNEKRRVERLSVCVRSLATTLECCTIDFFFGVSIAVWSVGFADKCTQNV